MMYLINLFNVHHTMTAEEIPPGVSYEALAKYEMSPIPIAQLTATCVAR